MASYPVEHMYDASGKPIGHPDYPGYPMVPQYPGVPHHYPMMPQGPYPPNPPDAGYSQAGIQMASVRDHILQTKVPKRVFHSNGIEELFLVFQRGFQ